MKPLPAFGVCVCSKPACKKEAVFYIETLTAASHYKCLLMPFLDLKAGLVRHLNVRPFTLQEVEFVLFL